MFPESTPRGAGARTWERLAAPVTIVLFLLAGLAYSLVVPAFETPDEVYHYGFVRHLAEGGGLPVQTVDSHGPWAHEGTQAPLYYFLAGRLTAGIDQSDFPQLAQRNPYANVGNPLYPGNKNMMLYSGAARPLRGSNLALHVARWLSLALTGLALACIYGTAKLAFPGSRLRPVLVLAFAAAIPQMAFVGAACSNDSAVIALSSAVIYWLARLLARDPARPIRSWDWSILGALLGLAALTKLPALGLIPLAGAAILWLAWQRRSWRTACTGLAWVGLLTLAIAGWWYWRNFVLYGEWLATRQLLSINGLRAHGRTWRSFVSEMRGLRYSFWGLFGWFSILLPDWIYRLLDYLTVVAASGLLLRLANIWRRGRAAWRSPAAPIWGLVTLWALAIIGLMLYWSTFAVSSQGRLLFPAMVGLSCLMVAGLGAWIDLLPRKWRTLRLAAQAALPVGLAVCSIWVVALLLPSSYVAPGPIAAIPAGSQPVNVTYGHLFDILAVDLPRGRYHAGDQVPVTLYLQARATPDRDVPLFVQLLNDRREVMGNVTSHAGWGRLPTSLWQPGKIYADRYLVQITAGVSERSPLLAQVYAGFMDASTRLPLPAIDARGEATTAILGTVPVAAAASLEPDAAGLRPAHAIFGDSLELSGYAYPAQTALAAGHLEVQLLWSARQAPGADYTVFVHLRSADGRQAGADGQPAEGRFPTRVWQSGDRSLARFDVALPADWQPGTYQVWTGLYETASQGGARLNVTSTELQAADGGVLLGTVELR